MRGQPFSTLCIPANHCHRNYNLDTTPQEQRSKLDVSFNLTLTTLLDLSPLTAEVARGRVDCCSQLMHGTR